MRSYRTSCAFVALLAILFIPALARAGYFGGTSLGLQVGGVRKVASTINFGAGFSLAGLSGGVLTIEAASGLLAGRSVSSAAPNPSDVIAWNGSAWAPAPSGTTLVDASITITQSAIVAKGAVTSAAFTLGTMPANARIMLITVGENFTAVDESTHASWTIDVNALSSHDIVIAQSVAPGASLPTGFGSALNTASSLYLGMNIGGATVTVTLKSNSTATLGSVTAGNVDVHLFYTVLP